MQSGNPTDMRSDGILYVSVYSYVTGCQQLCFKLLMVIYQYFVFELYSVEFNIFCLK